MTYNAPNHLITIPPEIFPISLPSTTVQSLRYENGFWTPQNSSSLAIPIFQNTKLDTLFGFISIYFPKIKQLIEIAGLQKFYSDNQTTVTMFIPRYMLHDPQPDIIVCSKMYSFSNHILPTNIHEATVPNIVTAFTKRLQPSISETLFEQGSARTFIQNITIPHLLTTPVLSSTHNMILYSIKSPNYLLISKNKGNIYINIENIITKNKYSKIIIGDIICLNGIIHIVE